MVQNINESLYVHGGDFTALKLTSIGSNVSALFVSPSSNDVLLGFKNLTTTEDENSIWSTGLNGSGDFTLSYGPDEVVYLNGSRTPFNSEKPFTRFRVTSEGYATLYGTEGETSGGKANFGGFSIVGSNNERSVSFDTSGIATFGGRENNGNIFIKNSEGNTACHLFCTTQYSMDREGNPISGKKLSVFRLGENGIHGELSLSDYNIYLDGQSANISVGGRSGVMGKLSLSSETGSPSIGLNKDYDSASISLNGSSAELKVGNKGKNGSIFVKNDQDKNTIELDGKSGDIRLLNADCAEEFDVVNIENATPGTVMVLSDESVGEVQESINPYDKKVAGVISGAGNFKPGILLDKKENGNDRVPIALMGKVYCKVDAQYASIKTGDLLTTSSTPGHAMKAGDSLQAFGAIIGKALEPLSEGKSLIPILVTLQ